MSEQFKEIVLPFVPDAGAPHPVLLQTDNSAALMFDAREKLQDGTLSEVVDIAIIRFPTCHATRIGYPNDEASAGIPRFEGIVYGAYEIPNSLWIDEVRELNRHSFPYTPYLVEAKHIVFAFHDSTFECIGKEMQADFSHELWEHLWTRIYEQVLRYAGR